MRKTKDGRKKVLHYASILLLIVFLFSTAFMLLKVWEKHRGSFPVSDIGASTVTYGGTDYLLKDNVETFLIMGLDKFDGASDVDAYNNDKQADFLMLLVFDNDAKRCTAIHINRDTMADVNVLGVAGNKVDTVTKQIALAHTYGNGRDVSCRNTADAVSGLLLGIRVNHYISLTMDSVATFNDLVGGVEVTVTDDFSGIDETLVAGQTVTLRGEHALNYVRTRYGLEDSSNSTRMKRQQQYLRALLDKTQQCIDADDEFIINASLQMSDYIVSDRSVTQLQELAERLAEYEFVDIRSLEGRSTKGEKYMEFYPDEESINDTVIDIFYEPKE